MVRITAQQTTDAYGRRALCDDCFVSDLRPVSIESIAKSVFENDISIAGTKTLAQLRHNDRFSLLALFLIKRGYGEHEHVRFGSYKSTKMVRIGNKEFRSHKYSIYERIAEQAE